MKRQQIWSSFLLFVTSAIWGIAFVAQSVGMEYVGPFTFSAVRSFLGGIVLIPCIFLLEYMESRGNRTAVPADSRKRFRFFPESGKERAELLKGGTACGVLLCLATNFQQIGIQYTTVGKAGFITALYIVIVPFLGMALFRKKYGIHIWAAVLLALAGLYLLCMTGGTGIGKGDFYVLLCSLLFSLHILVIDYFSPKVNGVKMSCIQFFVCGILSGVPALLLEEPSVHAVISGWQPILYAGVLSCGAAYTLQIIGQKHVSPTAASLIMSLESCVSVIAGWLILGETLTQRETVGCILMFAAVILSQLPEKQKDGLPETG